MSDLHASFISRDIVVSGSAHMTRSEQYARAFLARYSNKRTRDGYAMNLRQFFRWCAEVGIEPLDVTRNHIELFARDLEMHGRANATIAQKMNALAGYYRFAQYDRVIEENPMLLVRRPNVPRVSSSQGLTRGEFADLVRAISKWPAREQAIVLLLGYNGVRVSELCGIDIEHLARHEGQQVVRVTRKGGKVQLLPLAPRVVWQIEQTIGDRTEGPLFLNRDGVRIDRRAVGRVLKRACIAAGIKKRITPHSMRHTFVTMSLDVGRSERDVAVSVGHADTRLVAYYDRGRDSITRNTTHSVAAYIEGSL